MGLFGWLESKQDSKLLQLARKNLEGALKTAEIDPSYFRAVAENIVHGLNVNFPRNGRAATEYISDISASLSEVSADNLFDRASSLLTASNKIRKVLPARAEAMAFIAGWLATLSLADGYSDLSAEAGSLSFAYQAVLNEVFSIVDGKER